MIVCARLSQTVEALRASLEALPAEALAIGQRVRREQLPRKVEIAQARSDDRGNLWRQLGTAGM